MVSKKQGFQERAGQTDRCQIMGGLGREFGLFLGTMKIFGKF